MTRPINWQQLALQLGTLREEGEHGSTEYAQRAIEILLGEDRLREAVDFYVAGGPGSELARSVLWHLHPWSAMQRCYDIYRSDANIEVRIAAVELLRVVADRRALPWIKEFLDDPEPGIQSWGIGVLDQLLWSKLISPEEGEELLEKAEQHPNELVQEKVTSIKEYLPPDLDP